MMLDTLNQVANRIVEISGLDPFTFFLASITVSIILFAADLNKGVSLDIPGRGQVGLSASIFIFGALVMILSAEGYQFFFIEIAKTTLGLLIVTPIVYWMIGRR